MSTPETSHLVADLQNVTKRYGEGSTAVLALRGVSLSLPRGELIVVLGPSGSGKTTLLNVVGGIEPPTAGSVVVDGIELDGAEEPALTDFRRDHIGFVFQFFNLIPTLTALENVALIGELVGRGESEAVAALTAVGLEDLADRFPGQLSGGEQQRVAIARALVKQPALVLADEPTGSLDLETGRNVLGHLRQAAGGARTVVVVTHNSAIAAMADRVVHMHSGVIDRVERNPEPVAPKDVAW